MRASGSQPRLHIRTTQGVLTKHCCLGLMPGLLNQNLLGVGPHLHSFLKAPQVILMCSLAWEPWWRWVWKGHRWAESQLCPAVDILPCRLPRHFTKALQSISTWRSGIVSPRLCWYYLQHLLKGIVESQKITETQDWLGPDWLLCSVFLQHSSEFWGSLWNALGWR